MALTPREKRQLLIDLTSGRISKQEYDEIMAMQGFRDSRVKSGFTPPALTEAEKRLFERANSPINDYGFTRTKDPNDISDSDVPQGNVDPPNTRFPRKPEDEDEPEVPDFSGDYDSQVPPEAGTFEESIEKTEENRELDEAVDLYSPEKRGAGQGGSGGGGAKGQKYNLLGQLGPEGETNPDAPEGGPYIYDNPPGQGDNLGLDAQGNPITEAPGTGGGGSGSGTGDGGEDSSSGTESFVDSQIWEYNGEKHVVWQIPGTMMFMRYLATDEELNQFYSGRQRPDTVSASDTMWTSSVYFGNVFELDDDVITGGSSPFFGFVDSFEKATKGRPWLQDDDEMFALWVEGFVEDRQITEEEWGNTEWFNNATAEERSWLILSKGRGVGDADFPADAARKLEQDRIYWTKIMKDEGISNAETIRGANGETFAQWFAEQVTFGKLDVTKASEQIKGLSDATSGVQVEDFIQNWLEGKGEVAQTRTGYASARNLALKWLGPVYGSLDDETLARYAGIIRNAENPDVGAELLQEELKAQRKVLFSSDLYDENLTYEQIAAPWLNYSTRVLGERIDEKSEHWLNILLKNDQVEADKEITAYGLNNNIGKVVDDLSDEVALSVGVSESGVQRGFST